ncbi:MAG TPA: OB-fold nucleic acid binding domain-containing protein, partial [Dehalococcoidales bacterium]|nr:OB-fold nucleic acid binding domain-containing protein [Dehalococcoidales bacterium]
MSVRLGKINEQRLEKLNEIRKLGIDPYPPRFKRTQTTQQAIDLLTEQEKAGKTDPIVVTVAGRIMANRGMGKISFVDLRDGAGKIQLLVGQSETRLNADAMALFKLLDIGDFIGVTGKVFRTRSNEPTIEVTGITLLTKALQPLPEKWHGLTDTDIRYRQRYLDLISNE